MNSYTVVQVDARLPGLPGLPVTSLIVQCHAIPEFGALLFCFMNPIALSIGPKSPVP